jgi:N4-gp56 family major capsid protein
MRFRQFTTRKNELGKREGQTLLFDKIFDVKTAGGPIGEGQNIPKTGFSINQGNCKAIPYGNSIPWTEEFENFSEFDVKDPIQSRLIDDMAKAIDRAVEAKFRKTKIVYTPTGTVSNPTATWSATGLPTGTASRDIQIFDIKNIVDALKSGVYGTNVGAPVPPWDGDNYMGVLSTGACRALQDDSEWSEDVRFGDPERKWSGEVGRIYRTRFVEENHILGQTIGAAATKKGEGYIFGKEAVMEVRVVPEEIRRGIPGDFGRDRALAWYALLGHEIIWEFDATNEPDNRIVRIGSL